MQFVELESEYLIYRKFKPEDLPIFADCLATLKIIDIGSVSG